MPPLSTPLVSIIIPVFNGESSLKSCLFSVISQSYSHIEVILVNDGSGDRSDAICKEWVATDERIKYYWQENAGVSAARNKGLQEAQGEFLTFVDCDDCLPVDAIEHLLTLAQKYGVDMVSGTVEVVWPGRNSLLRHEEKALQLYTPEDVISNINYPYAVWRGYFGAWSRLYRVSLIREHGVQFDTELIIGEDFIFVLNYMLKSEKIIFSDHVCYSLNRTVFSATNGYIINYDAKARGTNERTVALLSPYFHSTCEMDNLVRYRHVLNAVMEECRWYNRDGIYRAFQERYANVKCLCSRIKQQSTKLPLILNAPYSLNKKLLLILVHFRQAWLICFYMHMRHVISRKRKS